MMLPIPNCSQKVREASRQLLWRAQGQLRLSRTPADQIAWAAQDLTYRVRNNNNRKEQLALLMKVSGYFRPGELAALVCRIFTAHVDLILTGALKG